MRITEIGYLLILLGIYALIFNRRLLYNLAVFFIPFSATAVINVGNGATASAIQPYMFFAFLYIGQSFIIELSQKRHIFLLDKKEFYIIGFLLLFLLVALISLIMPKIIDGNISANISGRLGERLPIRFSFRNITQYIYLSLGVIFSLFIYRHNKNIINLKRTIEIYAYSMIFVSMWGLFQLICFKVGINYPKIIFNNSANKSIAHDIIMNEGLSSSIIRLTSVGIEPSIIAQACVIFVPILIYSIFYKDYIFTERKDLVLLIGLLLFIMATTSSVGIVSLVFVGCVSILFLKRFILKKASTIFGFIFLFAIISLGLAIGFRDVLNVSIFNKLDSYSTFERLDNIIAAWEAFLKYPILGVGWGSITSFSMSIAILSATGILGFSCLVIFFIYLLNQHYRSRKQMINNSVSPFYPEAILTSLLVMLFAANIAGFSYYFGNYWFVVGISLINLQKDKYHLISTVS